MTPTQKSAIELALNALEPYADVKPRDWKTDREKLWAAHESLLNALVEPPLNFDDAAVERFAEALKNKMRSSREKGRYGWHDRTVCSEQDLQRMLVDHLAKGDPVDVGNFAMMLWNRGENVALNEPVVESVTEQRLAQMIMSDCGCSTDNQRLVDRIVARIEQYDRANIQRLCELPALSNRPCARKLV